MFHELYESYAKSQIKKVNMSDDENYIIIEHDIWLEWKFSRRFEELTLLQTYLYVLGNYETADKLELCHILKTQYKTPEKHKRCIVMVKIPFYKQILSEYFNENNKPKIDKNMFQTMILEMIEYMWKNNVIHNKLTLNNIGVNIIDDKIKSFRPICLDKLSRYNKIVDKELAYLVMLNYLSYELEEKTNWNINELLHDYIAELNQSNI